MKLKLKEIREKAGLSQEVMANKMNISQSAYARFELSKTKIDLNRLENFAKAINISVYDVLAYPEKLINIKEVDTKQSPEVTLQIKVKEEKKNEIPKMVLGENTDFV